KLPLVLDVEEPLTVGADRIVNTLAAAQLFKKDTIVVDFGTATTFDCITVDGGVRFIGGVIMPGLRTASDELVRKTAKLPATELTPPRARSVAGRRTAFVPACCGAPPTRWTVWCAASGPNGHRR